MKIYAPTRHRRRELVANLMDNLIYDARRAPWQFWVLVAALLLLAVAFVQSCAARHSLVAPEDRAGMRTYEAP